MHYDSLQRAEFVVVVVLALVVELLGQAVKMGSLQGHWIVPSTGQHHFQYRLTMRFEALLSALPPAVVVLTSLVEENKLGFALSFVDGDVETED